MMAACGGKKVAQKAAIQAEKALAADLIANAAYPSYAIQQIARPSRGGGFFISQNACGCADDRVAPMCSCAMLTQQSL
jgi:hypothetical protein